MLKLRVICQKKVEKHVSFMKAKIELRAFPLKITKKHVMEI